MQMPSSTLSPPIIPIPSSCLLQHHFHFWNTIPMPSPCNTIAILLPVATSFPLLEHNSHAFPLQHYCHSPACCNIISTFGTQFPCLPLATLLPFLEYNCQAFLLGPNFLKRRMLFRVEFPKKEVM